MELIKSEKSLKHKLPLMRRLLLPASKMMNHNYQEYLEEVEKIRFKNLGLKRKLFLIIVTILLGSIGLFSLVSFIENLQELYQITGLLDSFFAFYSETSNFLEKLIFKVVFAILMGMLYLAFAFFFIIMFKCFLFIISIPKPIKISKEEKIHLDLLRNPNTPNDLNPPIQKEKKIITNYEFQFSFLHPEIDLENFLLAIKPSFSLIGIQLSIGCILFFLAILMFFPEYEIIIGLILLLIAAIATCFLLLTEVIFPIQTFWEYHKLKRYLVSYFEKQINYSTNLLLEQETNVDTALEIIIFKEKMNEIRNLPRVPISNVIKLWTIPGLVLSVLSFFV